jgi:DNA processing protein
MNREDIIFTYLSLLSIKGVSHRSIYNLYKSFGTLINIFKADPKYLEEAGLTQPQIEAIKNRSFDYNFVDKEISLIKKYKIDITTIEDNDYPESLKNIYDPPAIFYTIGDKTVLQKPSIAIVGSRRATNKGKDFAKKLASDLSEIGFNIVSGFASGIDISAHIGALQKGTTVAVFGNGLLNVYPAQHKKFLPEIYRKGCIISELPLMEMPNAHNFPKRNRIITGLSLGVVVVEAAHKSGSLITSKLAIEYGRDLFAVPAWPTDQNTGTNKLIKEGAKLVENYLDILEEYSNILNISKNIDKNDNLTIITNNELCKKIIDILKEGPATIDEICLKSQTDVSNVLQIMTDLELEDIVSICSDGKYIIN